MCVEEQEPTNVYEEIPSPVINEPTPSTSAAADPCPSSSSVNQSNDLPAVSSHTPELDSAVLEIFGEDPSIVKEYSKEIQSDLAVRLQHIATNGLSKETRKELCDKYLPPSNCTLIDAPELNPEVKAAAYEGTIKRDKEIELKQK